LFDLFSSSPIHGSILPPSKSILDEFIVDDNNIHFNSNRRVFNVEDPDVSDNADIFVNDFNLDQGVVKNRETMPYHKSQGMKIHLNTDTHKVKQGYNSN
jgi:hypothetical protein